MSFVEIIFLGGCKQNLTSCHQNCNENLFIGFGMKKPLAFKQEDFSLYFFAFIKTDFFLEKKFKLSNIQYITVTTS